MSVSLFNVAFDCADPYSLGQFWSKVFDQPLHDDDHPGDPETSIALPDGPNLYFQRVPEAKMVKNRVHICLRPDGDRDAEVRRLTALGATLVDDRREPDGHGWVVLADPEGNELCVLRHSVGRDAT
ncbi:VOC family protein [Actinopolymorpha alba]|uniref:VOC family protein n=1 Tax=Actinopolymorpha alba TaxID=533267 RepID=UPI00037BA8A7|nr:VOC family protein [Actinopolymorpha alba]